MPGTAPGQVISPRQLEARQPAKERDVLESLSCQFHFLHCTGWRQVQVHHFNFDKVMEKYKIYQSVPKILNAKGFRKVTWIIN